METRQTVEEGEDGEEEERGAKTAPAKSCTELMMAVLSDATQFDDVVVVRMLQNGVMAYWRLVWKEWGREKV